MNISSRKAELLAQKVQERLKAELPSISPAKIKEIARYVKTYEKLTEDYDAASAALEAHENTLPAITGIERYHGKTETENIVAAMGKKGIPTISAIQNEIELQSMFAKDGDLDKFINGIVAKFRSANLQTKQKA